MKRNIRTIPIIQKSRSVKKESGTESNCCIQPSEGGSCCTPSDPDENTGACCAQPEDGAPCCLK